MNFRIKAFLSVCLIVVLGSSCTVMTKKEYKALINERDELATMFFYCNVQRDILEYDITKLRTDSAMIHEQFSLLEEHNEAVLFNCRELHHYQK
jgi:hypothetical protein